MRLCKTLLLLLGAVAFAEPASPRVVERYRQMLQANPTEGIALDRLWKIAVEDGRTGEWIAEYRKAGTFASEMILGHLLRKAGQAVEAENAYVRASALEPASVLPLLALGRAAGERGEPRQAAVWLEKAVALLAKDDPRVADALMQLGAAWSAGGEPARAVEAWERTIEFAPDDLDLRRRLASACAEGNLPDAAIRHFEFIATRANPGERVQALEQIARLQSAAGRHDDAMVTLERAVGITAPGNWRRAELLGQIIRLAQRRHAEEELERRWLDQAAASPRDLGCCLQLVEFYERTGNLERQREWLEKSLGLSPRNAEYEVRLARLLVQLDQVDDAAAHLDRALALEPRNTDRVFERAALDLRREDGVAARRRILALLAEHKGDDALRERALAFCQEHHLLDLVEEQLRAGAAGGSEEGIFALANFHFTQRRNADARAALQRIADGGGTDAARAARHLRAAQLLKAHGELSAAIGQVESALKLQRDSREGNLLLGEMRAGVLQFHEARIAFEAAYDLSRTDAERIEADGKLFESLRAGASLSQDAKAPGASAAARVEGHIRELMGRAGEETTAAAWLRVARWKAWNGDKASAVTFATKAADLEPKNPAPREFLARHAQANGESAYAVAYLREAMELNPAGRDGYLREIAQIELQIGNSAEALSILEQLARANPGHMDALSDLASAQERAGRLQEAATTLRRMLSIAPAPRKRETGALLLRVLEKLGLPDEGADLLLRSMDGAQDERERFNRFDELLLYCQRQERLPWLRSLLESRRKGRADDYFSTVALGRVLKLLGEKGAAFDLFADAVYSTPDQRLALPDLVREAEELGRLDAAVRLQEQFTRIAPQERPDGFLKLAALQLKTGDLEGTERTWERAVAKFPRDAEVLRQGADFHQAWGERAVAARLLRKLVALDPANLRAAADLGETEYAMGHLAEARTACELVMKLTQSVAGTFFPSDRGDGPWSERGAFADFRLRRDWSGARVSFAAALPRRANSGSRAEPDAGLRLGALRMLGEIALKEGGASLERWLAAWPGIPEEQPTEAMWALYFAGARDRVVAAVEEMAGNAPTSIETRQALIWMALESGLYGRLAAWLNAEGRSAGEMELFSQAFSTLLRAHPGTVGSAMMNGLFPDDAHARLWPSATELYRAGRVREAVALGRRVFERMSSQRAAVGRELARWHLSLGETDEAARVLAIAGEGEGDAFDAPVFAAIRDRYLLLPETQRAAYVAGKLKTTDERSLHGLMTRVLLYALEGNTGLARVALDSLLARRPLGLPGQDDGNSAARALSFATGAGAQLLEWNFPGLALVAWDSGLADEALVTMQAQQPVREAGAAGGGGGWSRRTSPEELPVRWRAQRDALAYLLGGKVEREQMLATLRLQPGGGYLTKLGEAIESQRGGGAAVGVFLRNWERDLQNPALLRKLIESCRTADDAASAEAVRKRCLDERINPGNDTTPREFALELADLLEARGAVREAVELMDRAVERNPGELRLLYRQAQLFERAGRPEEADAAWMRLAGMDGGTAHSRGALAQMLEKQGKFREAIEVRVRGGASGDTQLPVLYYKDGRTGEALAAFEKLTGSGSVYAAMTLAEAMGLRGEGRLARSVLISAVARATDAKAQMQARAKLLTIPGLPPERGLLARTRVRMRELAAAQPVLGESYFEFFDRYCHRFGIEKEWEEEVTQAWADGRGISAAGIVLLRRQCAKGDVLAAGQTCRNLLAAGDVSGAMLERIDAVLRKTHRPELRPLVAEANARRSWPLARGTLEWARLLDSQGSREEARSVLRRHDWLAGFPGGAEALGQVWLDVGDPEEARRFLVMAMREGALVAPSSVLAGLARVQIARKNFPAARLLLRRAFEEPSCHELDALVGYLDASGELPRWSEAAGEFGLSPLASHELKLALFSLFEGRGGMRDALALIAGEPSLVSAVGGISAGAGFPEPITCDRIRTLARKTGGFEESAAVLESLADRKVPDASPQLAALYADWAESGGDAGAALHHLGRAAALRPASWEFARRAAEMCLAGNDARGAKTVLERFLAVSQVSIEREAAFEIWERANSVSQGRKPGS